MIQIFSNREFLSSFEGELPTLISASQIDAYYTEHPRMLHSHKEYAELLYVRKGTGVYIVDEKRYDIKPGDLIVTNAGVAHDEDPQCSQDLYTYSCAISNVQMKELALNHLIPPGVCPVLETGEYADTVESMMGMLFALLSSSAGSMDETCHYITAALLSLILKHIVPNAPMEEDQSEEQSTGELLTARVKKYIDEHYEEPLTLQSIGDDLHVNMYYLSHVFKETTGYAPMQYIMRRRIGEAQSYLISTKLSVTKIAGMVGYDNPCHFNTIFAKYVGMSPSKYRKSYTQTGAAEEKKPAKKTKKTDE